LLHQKDVKKIFLHQASMIKCVFFVEICLILECEVPIRFLS
jgi:hypothetical protein